MRSKANTFRRIFVSDIHMGDDRSRHQSPGSYPYGWLSDSRRDLFESFVRTVCTGDAAHPVHEVAIVGDLFDEWICPAEYDPTKPPHGNPPGDEQFRNIRNHNHDAIEALKAIPGKLSYVSGNHDMLVKQDTMTGKNRGIFPNMSYTPDPKGKGHDVYHTDDGIWAEHGHWYGIGDAPHPTSTGTPFDQTPLPMGFFFSRLSAQKALKEGTDLDFGDIFEGWLAEFEDKKPKKYSDFRHQIMQARDELVGKEETGVFTPLASVVHRSVIGGLAGEFSTWIMERGFDDIIHNSWCPRNGATMNWLENIAGTLSWKDVEERYKGIFADWKKNHNGNVANWEALICDFWSLLPAVDLIMKKLSPVPKIVIMGHTHNPCVVRSDTPEGQPADWVYVNAGAWCEDVKHCTYVETEYDTGSGRQTYSLNTFADNGAIGTLKNGYVMVGGKGSRTRRPRPVVAPPGSKDPRLV